MRQEKWTTANMPDLSGKVIIVTGGNSGLGYESVKAFAEKGAEVILASRSLEKGQAAKAEIGNTKGKIVVMPLDLMDFASIKDFAEQFKQNYSRLDVLLNNAGIMTTPYFLTKDGLEAQNGTNHFGHFALTGQLIGLIKSTPNSRVVNVSSNAHKSGKMDFDNLLFENGKDYTPMRSYGRSKLANLLFTYELQRRFQANHINSIAVAAHPGVSQTNLAKYLEGKFWFKMLRPLFVLLTQSAAQGALPQIRAAVDPNVKGGEYYGPHKGMTGFPVIVPSNAASHNVEDAQRLWEVSEQLTGAKFNL
ncbi:MAG: SDR family NAD(P)-dependent oxidoreductase [Lewinellaceae bacterium]|nr:SDR family NAD(P)-dependent oxidoreductase [Lewinellaceae bacterium]